MSAGLDFSAGGSLDFHAASLISANWRESGHNGSFGNVDGLGEFDGAI